MATVFLLLVLLNVMTSSSAVSSSPRGRHRLDLCHYYAVLGKLADHPECARAIEGPTRGGGGGGGEEGEGDEETTTTPAPPKKKAIPLCSSAVALTQCSADSVACPDSGQVCMQTDGNKCCQEATAGIPVSTINAKVGSCPRPLGIHVLQDHTLGCWFDAGCPGIQKCCLEPNPVTHSSTRICRDPVGIANSGASICTLPLAVGSCTAPSQRFYYDSATGRCNPFTYSGCGGNANNFQSLASCQSTCGTVGVRGTPACPSDANVGLNCLYEHADACSADSDCLGREHNVQPSCCMTACGYKICYQY